MLQLLQVLHIRTVTNSTTLQLHDNYNYNHDYQLQHYNFNNINPTTTTNTATTTALHHTTSSCEWGDHCNHCNHSKKHNSSHLSVHPCITTTHLSYTVLALKLLPSPCAVLLVNGTIIPWYQNWLISGSSGNWSWLMILREHWMCSKPPVGWLGP